MPRPSRWLICVLLLSLCSCKKDQTAEKLAQECLNLLTAEALYLDRLDRMVAARPHLETASQLSVFISGKTISELLSVLKDASGPIPGIANARSTSKEVKVIHWPKSATGGAGCSLCDPFLADVPGTVVEKLGVRTIEGVVAEGTR